MNFSKITKKVASFSIEGKTKEAALWLLQIFDIQDDYFAGFEYREKANPDFILMTTEGEFGEPQKIRIPENTFEFPLPLMLSLLAHEMVHVRQKTRQPYILDRNEREWQAYYQMLFKNVFPLVPDISTYHKKAFANKALEYYNRMEPNGALQQKYANQKQEVEQFLKTLENQ